MKITVEIHFDYKPTQLRSVLKSIEDNQDANYRLGKPEYGMSLADEAKLLEDFYDLIHEIAGYYNVHRSLPDIPQLQSDCHRQSEDDKNISRQHRVLQDELQNQD